MLQLYEDVVCMLAECPSVPKPGPRGQVQYDTWLRARVHVRCFHHVALCLDPHLWMCFPEQVVVKRV